MDRQTVFLIILCLALYMLWGPILDRIWPPPPPTAHGTNVVAAVQQPDAATQPAVAAPAVAPASPIKSSLADLAKADPSLSAKTTTLENEQIQVGFTSLGGAIDRIVLKRFANNSNGRMILNEHSPFPIMAVAAGDVGFCAPYEWTASSNQWRAVHLSATGLEISKDFTLEPDNRIAVRMTLKNTGSTAVSNSALRVALGMAGPMDQHDPGDAIGLSFFSVDKASHQSVAELAKQLEKQHHPFEKSLPLDWAAVRNRYFTLLVTPSTPFASVQAEPHAMPPNTDPRAVKDQRGALAVIGSPPFNLSPGASTNWSFNLYTGPKEYRLLAALGKNQDDVLQLEFWGISFFKYFSQALLWMLSIFHGIFRNWGVSIIIVTIVIKILFWPLTAISMRSMKQMQALGPKFNALKEKYKDDSKKLNEEMMKMYREYGVNPMAGCFPMLVQIPILFAFYNVLMSSIELRGAAFFWIHDLSMPDTVARIPGLDFPINPMPLVMVATMIWQTKITPQAPNADPSMKMMVWLMPAMFLFFCYNFSSGLSLYWTVQNLLTILQTRLTKDKPVQPPQKVKAKAKGGFTFSRPVETRKK